MKSPKDMQIIQIDITNTCIHQCSNCTRFCGHHKKTFFMDFPTFKNAVDSLEGFPGMVGIIGGEPTLHPEFEKFCDYIQKIHGRSASVSQKPVQDLVQHVLNHFSDIKSDFGLWTSVGKDFYRHYETINSTFDYQLINDHRNPCQHQALLMQRKELKISDEEWIKKRDACWIQNLWSASITPKGAFFCEIAASLDMLFNGPGGWKVEKDWWKRSTDEFADQLHWCELCSAALDVPRRPSFDEVDDITPGMLEKLQEIDSPRIRRGRYVLLDLQTYDPTKYKTMSDANEYMKDMDALRTTKENRDIYPKTFDLCIGQNPFAFVREKQCKDWVVVAKSQKSAETFAAAMKDFILNPGCVYIYRGAVLFNVLARSIRDVFTDPKNDGIPVENFYPKAQSVQLNRIIPLNPSQQALRKNIIRFITAFIPVSKYRRRLRQYLFDRYTIAFS